VLPSREQQEANRARWASFWEGMKSHVQGLLREEGRALGFSQAAFEPFLERLTHLPPPVGPEDLREAGLGDLLDTLMQETPDGVRVITLAEGRPDLLSSEDALDGGVTGARWVSEGRFADAMSVSVRRDFVSFLLEASTAALLLLFVMYRSLRKVAFTLVPVATGLILMLGIMGAAGIRLNLFNIIAAILVIGLCVDYGIFMVDKLSAGHTHATEKAMLVSGLTTLAGLGSLVLARHPALHSIGITVLVGIGLGIPAALLVIPALYPPLTPSALRGE
jgi:predicted exporter